MVPRCVINSAVMWLHLLVGLYGCEKKKFRKVEFINTSVNEPLTVKYCNIRYWQEQQEPRPGRRVPRPRRQFKNSYRKRHDLSLW